MVLDVARIELGELGVEVAGLRICVGPRSRGHRRVSRLRSTAVEFHPVTISHVVGSTVDSMTSVSARPPSVRAISSRRAPRSLPARGLLTTACALRSSCCASSAEMPRAASLSNATSVASSIEIVGTRTVYSGEQTDSPRNGKALLFALTSAPASAASLTWAASGGDRRRLRSPGWAPSARMPWGTRPAGPASHRAGRFLHVCHAKPAQPLGQLWERRKAARAPSALPASRALLRAAAFHATGQSQTRTARVSLSRARGALPGAEEGARSRVFWRLASGAPSRKPIRSHRRRRQDDSGLRR